jgi:type II secretory pathway component GspD/PulD (secretin)
MKYRPRLLTVLFALLCLAAPALSAPGGKPPRAVDIGGYGTLERGPGPPGQGRWRGFPISLSLQKAPLPDVLRAFAELAGFNLLLDPRVQGEVTVELKNVPWDLALHSILKLHGLGAEVDGTVWMIRGR